MVEATVYKDNGNFGRQLNPDNGVEEYILKKLTRKRKQRLESMRC